MIKLMSQGSKAEVKKNKLKTIESFFIFFTYVTYVSKLKMFSLQSSLLHSFLDPSYVASDFSRTILPNNTCWI